MEVILPLGEEFLGAIDLDFEVALARVRAEADFLWGAVRRVAAALTLHPGLFVLVSSVVEELADRGAGIGRDFDQVQTCVLSHD